MTRAARGRVAHTIVRGVVLGAVLGASGVALAVASHAEGPGGDRGLELASVAGTLNGEPVSLAEVDAALKGEIRRAWREFAEVTAEAARALCAERAEARIAERVGVPVARLRGALWEASAGPRAARDATDPDSVHRLRILGFRRQLRGLSEAEIAGRFALHFDAAAEPEGEPVLPPRVARCLDADLGREEVEAYAAFPLYRRRAAVVATACRQFEIDHSIPLVVRREARRRGTSVEAMLGAAEAEARREPDPARIEAIARQQYGHVDEIARTKVRLALELEARAQARLGFLEELRDATRGECGLARPAAPSVAPRPRAGGPREPRGGGLPVIHFGAFRCRLCPDAWREHRALAERWGERVRLEFRHHFPDASRAAFEDALDAECSARQGRLDAYATWRTAGAPADTGPARALGLDAEGFARCRADPATAIRVLADVDEAQRLGFREALPSWVVGSRPRRGFQGAGTLDGSVTSELAAAEAPPDALR